MKVASVIVMALAGSAFAAPYEWNFAGEAHNNVAGTITSAKMKFNSNTQMFSWDVTFGDGVAKGTDGYTLAVSPGPNPKGHAFELALIYFDATDMNNVAVSVYRYNGENNANSFSNPGDLLASNLGGPFTSAIVNATASDNAGARTFSVAIDATSINSAYGAPANPEWTGVAFGEKMGLWFHPAAGLTTAYDGEELTKWTRQKDGWLDGSDFSTVPAPASSLLALSLAGLAARRRRQA